jgi:hypothetical protein
MKFNAELSWDVGRRPALTGTTPSGSRLEGTGAIEDGLVGRDRVEPPPRAGEPRFPHAGP